MKMSPILKYFDPLRGPNGVTCKYKPRPKIKNLTGGQAEAVWPQLEVA